MTKDEALKLALEALELHGEQYPHMVKGYCLDAIAAIKEALAQPDKNEFNPDWDTQAVLVEEMQRMAKHIEELKAQPEQEPVAWKGTDEVVCPVCSSKGFPWPKCGHITYLERTPPQRTWVGLTEEERYELAVQTGAMSADWLTFMAAVEAKLKEKNT